MREVEGGGGSQTLNWSVGASRDFCVRHKPKLATCVQTPGPSMACWRSPLIRAYVTMRSNFEGPNLKPQSNPPLTPHHHYSGHLQLKPVSCVLREISQSIFIHLS